MAILVRHGLVDDDPQMMLASSWAAAWISEDASWISFMVMDGPLVMLMKQALGAMDVACPRAAAS